MKMFFRLASRYLGLYLICSACVLFPSNGIFTYDSQILNVQHLNLFNQKSHSDPEKSLSWTGDWIFRRERLTLIDSTLKNIKPEIIFFTGMMEKQGNPYDTDQAILAAGSLFNYQWLSATTDNHAYTGEIEKAAIVFSPSLLLDRNQDGTQYDFSDATIKGLVTINKIEGQETSLAVIQVDVNAGFGEQFEKLKQSVQKVRNHITSHKACQNRLLLAVRSTIPLNSPEYEAFLDSNHLQDSAKGFCKNLANCYTRSSQNELSVKAIGDQPSETITRILASKEVIFYDSKRNFDDFSPASAYQKRFQLSSFFMTHEFGWKASLRLPGCNTALYDR